MLYDRQIQLNIRLAEPSPALGYRGTLDVENLRISFSVFKTVGIATNTANIRVYNLSTSKRNQLNNYGNEIKLLAGYRANGGPQLLFLGNNSEVSHTFADPNIISILECGDGEKILNLIIVTVSFGPRVSVRTVIQSIADQMGVNIVDFAMTENLTYANGFEDSDLAKNTLDKAVKKLNLRWTIQNGDLYILPNNAGNTREPFEINASNGMVGVPERYTDRNYFLYNALPPNSAPKNGWKVRTLLRPEIIPGDNVRLRSIKADINGLFYVVSARHEGDNFGRQFESNFEVIAI